MALNITAPSDYKGYYKLAKDCYSEKDLQLFINKYETYYICQLLGADLSKEFESDLVNGVPQTQKFLDIFDPFCLADDNNCLYQSEGMKEVLKGLIYYNYATSNNIKQTISGSMQNASNNSVQASINNIYRDGEQRYNLSIPSIRAIQWFICENKDVYFSDTVKNSMQDFEPVFQGLI